MEIPVRKLLTHLRNLAVKQKRIMKYGLPVLFFKFYKMKDIVAMFLPVKHGHQIIWIISHGKITKTVINIENVNIMRLLFQETISLRFKN